MDDEDWMSSDEEALLISAVDELESQIVNTSELDEPHTTTPENNCPNKNPVLHLKSLKAVRSDGREVHQSDESSIADAKHKKKVEIDVEITAEGNGLNESQMLCLCVHKQEEETLDLSDSLEAESALEREPNPSLVTNSNSMVINPNCGECMVCRTTVDENQPVNNVKNSNILINLTPLEIFRGRYLKVTDLTAQAWCEQQLVYSFTVPKEVITTPAMQKGSDIHLAKELEVHDIEQVIIETKEDRWAIKFLNILTALRQLLNGVQCIREMPIFGDPFQMGIFAVGIIDEIRWTEEQLEIVEFKTRVKPTLPAKAQKKTHRLQVSVYKHLFDAMVKGHLTAEAVAVSLGLDLGCILTKNVLVYTKQAGIESDQLEGVINKTLEVFKFLPCVNSICAEYMCQEGREPFARESYVYDEIWLKDHLVLYSEYWMGKRDPVGVDIEDAWKCHKCAFEESCEWKEKMIKRCVEQNRVKRLKIL